MGSTYVFPSMISVGRAVRCESQIIAAIDAVATSITLVSGHGANFPSDYPFYLLCESELFSCANKAGDIFTITRGEDSTTPASHALGTLIRLVIGSFS